MNRLPRSWWWLALLGALTLLYVDALRVGFLNDDYLFLEEAKRRSLWQSLSSLGPLGNFYRPLSRQIYYELLAPLSGGQPLVYHLVNFALFLGALGLVADLLGALLPLPGVLAGTLYFATLPLQRVNLIWISCSQDLLALFFSLATFAFFRRRRHALAAVCYVLAVFSKESALPLPLALAAWVLWIEPRQEPIEEGGLQRRLAPFGVVIALWVVLTWWVRGGRTITVPLHFGIDSFAAGYVHGLQTLLGLDHPSGFVEGLAHPRVYPLALLLLAPIAIALRRPAQATPDTRRRATLAFALAWLLAFGLVLGPVVARWSSYYYTLFAIGGALLVGVAAAGVGAVGWLVLSTSLLWWHGASTSTRAFAIAERPWIWTSHLTPFYFERAAILTRTLSRDLVRLEPHPTHGTRFFFSLLPEWAGFQMGNGALVRWLYRDASIESYFYTQFSESTAADHPCRFFYWDGSALAPLYPSEHSRFFQVGTDLLAIDRLDGALHAFRRSLGAGEPPMDPLYWMGWAELWSLRRGLAERAWTRFGAKDDSTEWMVQMRRARQALMDDRDTLSARRALAAAIRSGIGHPEPHAVLGELLLRDHPKYAVLELKVTSYLKPDDWVARRDLVVALHDAKLDDESRLQLAQLAVAGYDWRRDSVLVAIARTMQEPNGAGASVVQF